MLEKVRQIITERRLLARGEQLLVGVSGGPDSVALLDTLVALAPEFGWKLQVAHFNHQLRGADAVADEAFVRELAAGYGLAFSVGRGDVRAFAAEHKLSIEDAARRLRHGFFQDTARALGLAKLALGHTSDDQVETLLQRLLRGAGTHGLTAIHASNRLGALTVVRPLLDVWKTEVLGYARQRGLKFRQDASNWDPQFQRNKIRHELIPALERDYNPALKTLLHQTAGMLATE
ncbi:MAG: tRNA lysidine(34) synthetase TilS, partial [Verrucomicrobiia bacterium]